MMKTGFAGRMHVVLLVLVISVCAGCSRPQRLPERVSLNIAFQEWVGYGIFYLGMEKGFFKDEGVDLVYVDEQLDSARRDAFKQNMLDCEGGTMDLLVSKAASDTPVVAVTVLGRSFGGDGIVADASIEQLKDLSGRKIALPRDDVGETFLSYVLMTNGLSLSNVVVVSTRPDKTSEPFLNGEAEACVTWEPDLTRALKKPGAHLLASSREYADIIVDTLNVRRDLVANNPETVKKLMRGWFKALEFYRLHPDEAVIIMARYYKLAPGEYKLQIAGLEWLDYAAQVNKARAGGWSALFDKIAGLKLANGRITRKPEASCFLDTALLEKLYETGK